SVTDGSRGVSAAIVKPWARSWARSSGHFSIRANGTLNVAAIDVRIALRYSGSQQVGLRSTASEENAAALRNTPPTLSALVTPSSITTIVRLFRVSVTSASRPANVGTGGGAEG